MSKAKNVLRMHREGYPLRDIAKKVRVSKNTALAYIKRANADELSMDELLELNDQALAKRLGFGKGPGPDSRHDVFKALFPYYHQQMENKSLHLTLERLWKEYAEERPDSHYGLTQFKFYYAIEKKALEEADVSTPMADMHMPGLRLQVDFAGSKLCYFDTVAERTVEVEVFVACLPASGYTFAMAVPSQKTEDFVAAMAQCLRFLGGVPHILVPDNLKAAIIKYDGHEPVLNRVLDQFANHYGLVVDPARPRRPKDKASVEGMVKILYNRVYAPMRDEHFFSLGELNDRIAELVAELNRAPMKNLPWSREERFLNWERPALLPLPERDFEEVTSRDLKVQNNCCVQLERHWYSVPYVHVGQTVHVDFTRSMVRIYSQDGEPIATHRRDKAPGGYTVVNEHLASRSREWRMRTKDRYILRANVAMPELGRVFIRIFDDGRPEEVHYRTCDGLLRLLKVTGRDVFRMACNMALTTGYCNYKYIKRCIENGSARKNLRPDVEAPNPSHDNVRGPGEFK